MSYYTKEELLLKSYDALYKIALEEKLLNIYTHDMKKKELIDLILKYRENKFYEQIISKDINGFLCIQKIIDENITEVFKSSIDIEVPHSMIIYENKKINKKEAYYILINKQLNIDTSFILLAGTNNYIYAIFSVIHDDSFESEMYEKYFFSSNYVDRFNFDIDFFENAKFLFFESNVSIFLKQAYKNKKLNYIPKKLLCYCVKICEFKIKKLCESNKYFPVLFIENKLISKYFSYEFAMYIRKIADDHIYIDFFEDAKKTIIQKDYIFYGSFFCDIVEFFQKPNEEIKIYDDYSNNKRILKKELVDIFLDYLFSEVISNSCEKFLGLYTIGINVKREYFKHINIPFIINYSAVQKNLLSNFESDKYLIICSEYDNFNISTNSFTVREKDINYDIRINTVINFLSHKLNYYSIIQSLMILLKIKISKLEFNLISFSELMEKINSNEYLKIKDDIQNLDADAEKIFSINYREYEHERNDVYLEIKKNYYFLFFKCQEIFEKYCDDASFADFYIEKYNIYVNKNEIEMFLSFKIYNFLNKFFKKYKILDLLSNYKGVKLVGKLVKSPLFYNLLKEFIPGKIIKFSCDNRDNYSNLIATTEKYVEDLELAKINCINDVKVEKKNLEVLADDFKNEYVSIVNSKNKVFGYIDRLSVALKINITINNLDTNDSFYNTIYLPKIFLEKDENQIDIDQIYLDNIDNGIVRIFFFLNNVVQYKCAKRIDDQIFVSKYFDIIIDE